jgi:hypothetical protein
MKFALLVLALIPGFIASAQTGAPILVLADGPNGVEKADAGVATITGTEWREAPVEQNELTMNVLFKDLDGIGFREASLGEMRRARLYDALRYVADTLNASGELNVMIGPSKSDVTGALAQGGPMFASLDGLTQGNVFQRLKTGTVPSPNSAEMVLTFNWGYKWHLGTDAPPSDALDLRSVLVHEITHCLGFISLIAADGSSRFSSGSGGTNTYTVFDSMLAKKPSLNRLLGGTPSDPLFVGLAADLTGGAVVFAGPAATAAFGTSPPVYSASPFAPGTSLQHWVEDEVPDAVMQPRYAPGAMRRLYASVDIAVLRDIGWTEAEAPEQDPCPIQSVTVSVTPDASNMALMHFRANVALDMSDASCQAATGVLHVEYFIDGVSRGESGDETNGFPLNLTLAAGTHTVRASATRTDTSEDPVEAEKNFSIATVPDVLGKTQSAAETAITGAALVVGAITQQFSETVPLGCVISQTPAAGTAATPGTSVAIVVSLGSQPTIEIAPADTIMDFGSVNTGGYVEMAYAVKNSGGGTLTGTASLAGDMQFQFVGASTYSLAAGASTTITVRFTPDKAGNYAGILSFGGNGGSSTIALSGSGVKTGGLFNCAGGREISGFGAADLLVALLVLLALTEMHWRRAKQ